jgi:hypothetical protein
MPPRTSQPDDWQQRDVGEWTSAQLNREHCHQLPSKIMGDCISFIDALAELVSTKTALEPWRRLDGAA